jgi:hypothetical protein
MKRTAKIMRNVKSQFIAVHKRLTNPDKLVTVVGADCWAPATNGRAADKTNDFIDFILLPIPMSNAVFSTFLYIW